MIQTCRNQLVDTLSQHEGPKPSHAGLLLSRYLKETDDKGKGKRSLINKSINASKASLDMYKLAFDRLFDHSESLKLNGSTLVTKEFSVKGRLVIGLGSESVLETGLTLHHIYGTPIIPGSALKGLASHYCDQVWGKKDREFCAELEDKVENEQLVPRTGKYHRTLFGDTDDAGHIIFHDAWITPASLKNGKLDGLALDVMTPHHNDYYSDGSEAPTDFDDPNPVFFLSVTGTFCIAISCDVQEEKGKKWETLAMTLLGEALKYWGIGGKTNSGYGRMLCISKPQSDPFNDFKSWFETQKFGGSNKGSHEKIIEKINKLSNPQEAKEFVRTKIKQKLCAPRLKTFLNEK